MNPTRDDHQRILVVRNDRLGDLVLTLPALEAIRRQWPRAHVSLLVSRYAAPLLAGCTLVDELIEDDPNHSGLQLAARLREKNFDAALVLNTSTRNCLAVWAARIKTRVCWAYKAAGWLAGNRRVYLHRSHPPVHEAEFALEFVRRLGAHCSLSDFTPRLAVDPRAWQQVQTRFERDLGTHGPLFGVHPGNGNSAYNWPLDYYATLVSRLAVEGRVVVTGGPAERAMLEQLRSRLSPSARGEVLLVSDFSLPQLVAALSQLTTLTASSTGPLHVAGVLGTHVVGLFSPHPAHVPAKWAPLGSGHTLLIAPLHPGENPRVPREQGPELMARITVDQVVAANLQHARASAHSHQAA